VIGRLACSLVGTTQPVQIMPGTLVHRAYGSIEVVEPFRCSYGLNPVYRDRIERGGIVVSGVGPDGEARTVELPRHRFFVGTLYLPQLVSRAGEAHPLIVAYLRAALDGRTSGLRR
jgi:CTP synthase (UTP-ammonia lyase)